MISVPVMSCFGMLVVVRAGKMVVSFFNLGTVVEVPGSVVTLVLVSSVMAVVNLVER